MKTFKNIAVLLLLMMGVASGALLAAVHDGRITLARSVGGGELHGRVAATPVCNPYPVEGMDLDGELPGGG
jgi:hypothetical protein